MKSLKSTYTGNVLSEIFPELLLSQLWKSYFVLTHQCPKILPTKGGLQIYCTVPCTVSCTRFFRTNNFTTKSYITKAGALWEKQKIFPKHYKRKQITNWWHIPKNPGHKNVHCHPWKKKLSAWAVLEPRPLALEPMALPLSYCTWLRACSLQTTNITLISPFQFF